MSPRQIFPPPNEVTNEMVVLCESEMLKKPLLFGESPN